jgi:hypothetical protein
MHVSRARFTAEAEGDEERALPSLKNASPAVVDAVSVGRRRSESTSLASSINCG